jgi:pantothenate kinase-related protein Tda10
MIKYFYNIFIGLDQLANCLLAGEPDETLSARAWRTEQEGKLLGKICRPLIDTLLFFDKNHCEESYVSEKQRKQLPSSYAKYSNCDHK